LTGRLGCSNHELIMSNLPLLELVSSRRSAQALGAPGPSPVELEAMLRAAGSVPDHGLLRPFRFLVAEGEGRGRFGDALAAAAAELSPGLPPTKAQKVRDKAFRSPTLVAVIFSPKPGKIERWEQSVTAACAGYAVLLAARALGVGAVWKSVPFTKARAFTGTLGLAESEEMLGWIHLGTAEADSSPPARPPLTLADIVTVITPSGSEAYRGA
jgi:nitroreductase